MTKPDWKDAPEWAQGLAQDFNGAWYWFETLPRPSEVLRVWLPLRGRQQEACGQENWRESLEQRPAVQP